MRLPLLPVHEINRITCEIRIQERSSGQFHGVAWDLSAQQLDQAVNVESIIDNNLASIKEQLMNWQIDRKVAGPQSDDPS